MKKTAGITYRDDLDIGELRKLLLYDKKTGFFYWQNHKKRPSLNGTMAGSVRPSHSGNKYITIRIYGDAYTGHRLAWAYTHGEWPDGQIDHIDRNGLNNKIENLRVVTNSENQRNRRTSKGTITGIKGVRKVNYKGRIRWVARIYVDHTYIHLGTFETRMEAANCRLTAEKKYGFISETEPQYG